MLVISQHWWKLCKRDDQLRHPWDKTNQIHFFDFLLQCREPFYNYTLTYSYYNNSISIVLRLVVNQQDSLVNWKYYNTNAALKSKGNRYYHHCKNIEEIERNKRSGSEIIEQTKEKRKRLKLHLTLLFFSKEIDTLYSNASYLICVNYTILGFCI